MLTKDEPDDAYEMNLDAEIPPPNFVTLKFHLDDNDAFEEEVVDPLAFQGDEILETFSSNDQHRKRRRKKICVSGQNNNLIHKNHCLTFFIFPDETGPDNVTNTRF